MTKVVSQGLLQTAGKQPTEPAAVVITAKWNEIPLVPKVWQRFDASSTRQSLT